MKYQLDDMKLAGIADVITNSFKQKVQKDGSFSHEDKALQSFTRHIFKKLIKHAEVFLTPEEWTKILALPTSFLQLVQLKDFLGEETFFIVCDQTTPQKDLITILEKSIARLLFSTPVLGELTKQVYAESAGLPKDLFADLSATEFGLTLKAGSINLITAFNMKNFSAT